MGKNPGLDRMVALKGEKAGVGFIGAQDALDRDIALGTSLDLQRESRLDIAVPIGTHSPS